VSRSTAGANEAASLALAGKRTQRASTDTGGPSGFLGAGIMTFSMKGSYPFGRLS
jgi:hypothetical protein